MATKKQSTGYNGNENLPKAGTKYALEQWQLDEYEKCMKSPAYFAEKYFKIVHVDHGLQTIQLYDFQREASEAYLKTNKLLLATSRQIGKTTIATVILLHYALFNEEKRIWILANKESSATEVLERIQLAYEWLPHWLKPGVSEWNKTSIVFENGSKIRSAATSSDSVRGKSASMLYIDETAFVQNWTEFSASVLPVLSSGKSTKIILTSTPNGLNHFYEYYIGAKNGTNGFHLQEVKWYDVPGRDEEWRQEIMRILNGDEVRFRQEFEVEFLGSSDNLIDGSILKNIKADALNVKPVHISPSYGYTVFENPVHGHNYVITVDVSRGKGLDYSAFQVIDVTDVPYKQVARFKNNIISPRDLATFIVTCAKQYNDAMVLIEINDIGAQVSDVVYYDYEYENILFTESAGSRGKRIAIRAGTNVDKGLRTTVSTKSTGCAMLKLLVEQRKLVLNDMDSIDELSTFSKKGKSYEAETGKHDDLVMCLVLFAWLTTDSYFKSLTDIDIMHSLREMSDEQIFDELTPFGVIHSYDFEPDVPEVININGIDYNVIEGW